MLQPQKHHLPQPYMRKSERYNYYSKRITIVANATEWHMIDVSVDGILVKQVPFSFDEEICSIICDLREEAYMNLK